MPVAGDLTTRYLFYLQGLFKNLRQVIKEGRFANYQGCSGGFGCRFQVRTILGAKGDYRDMLRGPISP
jgi:hypothetical protein